MRPIINLLLTTIILFALSEIGWFLHVDTLTTALVVAVLLMVIRAIIKVLSVGLMFLGGGVGFAVAGPLGALLLVVFPLILFVFASSYAMLEVPRYVSGFTVNGFWAAVIANFIIGVFTSERTKEKEERKHYRR